MASHSNDGLPSNLLRFRAERGISLRELGKLLDLDPTGLSRIERGLTTPRRDTRWRIERLLRRKKAA